MATAGFKRLDDDRRAVARLGVCGTPLTAFLTLFVVPAAYSVIARNTKSPGHVSKRLEKLRAGEVVETG